MNIFCSKCGVKSDDVAVFCSSCGAPLLRTMSNDAPSESGTSATALENDTLSSNFEAAPNVSHGPNPQRASCQLSNGKGIELLLYRGVVIASRESESIRIHQGREFDFDGNNRPGQISSSIVSTHKIWVRSADGMEKEFDLSGMDISVREDQYLEITCGSAVDGMRMQVLKVTNLSTNYYFSSTPNLSLEGVWRLGTNMLSMNTLMDFMKFQMCIGGIIFILMLMNGSTVGYSLTGFMFGAIPSGLVWMIATVTGFTPLIARMKRLQSEIAQLVETIFLADNASGTEDSPLVEGVFVVKATQVSSKIALMTWIGTLFLWFVPGLVIYMSKKGDPYTQNQSKEALNWSISLFFFLVGAGILSIAIPMLPSLLVVVCHLTFCTMGAIASSKSKAFKVPFAIRLIK